MGLKIRKNLNTIKLIFIVILISFLNLSHAIEFKPTHIINENNSRKITGEELYWIDKTGKLNANEVASFIPEFKKLSLFTEDEKSEIKKSSPNFIKWHLAIVKNNSNKDFNLRIKTRDSAPPDNDNHNPSIVHILNRDGITNSLDTRNNGKFNQLAASHWDNEYKENKSRYDTILISKNESTTLLRCVGQDNFSTESSLRLSEHQAELEIDRFLLYFQGVGFGALAAFLVLAFYTATLNKEKSNLLFFIWLLFGITRILMQDIDGDRLSEFFINNETNKFNTNSFQSDLISGVLFHLTHFSFVVLAYYLIDVDKNFPKWKKPFAIILLISVILLIALFYALLKFTVSDLNSSSGIMDVILSSYFIIAFGIIGVGLIAGTITLIFRGRPQAIYLLLCELLMISGGFITPILHTFFETSFNHNDNFLSVDLVFLIRVGLLVMQALLLNLSIIRRMKYLQAEVIEITNQNRQILAEQNEKLEIKVKERTHELHLESQKSERLMLNILPQSIATRLKAGDESISDSYKNATILFSDLVGFTKMSSGKTAEDLVFLLNDLFKRFDTRATSLGLEKIKTIGDAYMVAGGLPTNDDEHAVRVTKMALGMYEDLEAFNKEHGMELDMRIGINSGPVVAGVIGHSKFSYDLWGNTVNTASRMESTCLPGKVQVSPSTYEQIKGHFDVQENQLIECKGLGQIMTYFVK